MKQILNDFTNDVLKQLFGWSKPRQGKIILTRYTSEWMQEYGLDFETLEDVFRHGEGKAHKIVQKYANEIVGLYHKAVRSKNNPSEYTYVITTCWKRKRYYRK